MVTLIPFKKCVCVFVYTSLKKKNEKKIFWWWDRGCLAFFPTWNTCVLQIKVTAPLASITRKIFSRWLCSVPSDVISDKCKIRTRLRGMLYVDLAILELFLPWRLEPGSRIWALPARVERCPCLDSALVTWSHWDWQLLGEGGARCFVKNRGGSEMLPHFADMSFLYVNAAETRHWGRRILYPSQWPGQQPEWCCSDNHPYPEPPVMLGKQVERGCGLHSRWHQSNHPSPQPREKQMGGGDPTTTTFAPLRGNGKDSGFYS